MSSEFDVLLSEIHKGKSVILTESAGELKELISVVSAVNVVLPEGQTVTDMNMTS